MKNSRKKIFILSTIVILFSIAGASYYLMGALTKTESTDVNYRVERDAETYAEAAKSAVESYANQDIAESKELRKNRLWPYFVSNSPVFDRDIEIRSTKTPKTTAKATSVRLSVEDSGDPTLVVGADVTSLRGATSDTQPQRYLVTLIKSSDGSFLAKDMEVLGNAN